jgi:hypothetical protein
MKDDEPRAYSGGSRDLEDGGFGEPLLSRNPVRRGENLMTPFFLGYFRARHVSLLLQPCERAERRPMVQPARHASPPRQSAFTPKLLDWA